MEAELKAYKSGGKSKGKEPSTQKELHVEGGG